MRALVHGSVFLIGVTLLVGCGEAKLAPVKGRVTCDGKPLENAAITFSPLPANTNDLESPKAASGGINQGRFDYVSTFKKGDGAFIGKHRVMITMEFPETCPCLPTQEIILEVKPGSNEFDIELRDHSARRRR